MIDVKTGLKRHLELRNMESSWQTFSSSKKHILRSEQKLA